MFAQILTETIKAIDTPFRHPTRALALRREIDRLRARARVLPPASRVSPCRRES